MSSKFMLLLFVARYLTSSDLGIYGLVTVTIALLLYVVGADYYVFTIREMLSNRRSLWPSLIRDQALVYVVTYALIIPVITALSYYNLIPNGYCLWAYLLLILEHIAQEIYRILVALSKAVIATCTVFFRTAAWSYIVMLLFLVYPESRNIGTLVKWWALGDTFAICMGVYCLKDLPWRRAFQTPINFKMIRRGLLISLPFLLGTLALRATGTIDRYLLNFYVGKDIVGIYTFYSAVASAIQQLVDSGVLSLEYPRIVSAYQAGEIEKYASLFRRFSYMVVASTIVFSIAGAILIYPVLLLLHRSVYLNHLYVYYALVIAVAVNLFAMIPHFSLYARNKDMRINLANLMGLITSCALNFVLIPSCGMFGAALAYFGCGVVVLFCKIAFIGKGELSALYLKRIGET